MRPRHDTPSPSRPDQAEAFPMAHPFLGEDGACPAGALARAQAEGHGASHELPWRGREPFWEHSARLRFTMMPAVAL
jgi:hypothetical protein